MPKLVTNIEGKSSVRVMRRQLAQILAKLRGDQPVSFVFKMVIDDYRGKMQNLDFVLMGHQDWDVQSAHTGAIVGAVRFNPGWSMFSFESAGLRLDSASMREIAKFLDEQDGLRRQQ